MSTLLNRTTLQYRARISPDLVKWPDSTHLTDGDYSAVSGQPQKYWVNPVVGSSVLLMDQTARDAVDVALAAANVLVAESRLEARIGLSSNPLPGEVWSIVVSGLEITVTHDPLIGGFVHTVVADSSDTTYIQVLMMYEAVPDEGEEKFFIRAFEKTTGEYADILPDEVVVDTLGEYTLPANGTDLVKV